MKSTPGMAARMLYTKKIFCCLKIIKNSKAQINLILERYGNANIEQIENGYDLILKIQLNENRGNDNKQQES